MMLVTKYILAVISLVGAQQFDPRLVGTWTSKSRTVYTGPDFYNPVSDTLTEPTLPGISYAFTADGWYEEAYYRASSNPVTPSCPSAVLQWQHGRYEILSNNSIVLNPIAVDGRQTESDPCSYEVSIYSRYSQAEFFLKYAVYTDPYHGIMRLDLYQFNGAPMQPLYLAYNPPQMLPTQTLNPTTSAATANASAATQHKRQMLHLPQLAEQARPTSIQRVSSMPVLIWWLGSGLAGLGALALILT